MTPFVQDVDFTLYHGDCLDALRELRDASVNAVVTSPPYMDARPDYEPFSAYPDLFRELGRVVTDAALFNVGRVFRSGIEQLWWVEIVHAARHQGWSLLDTLVWVKPNANPIHGQVFANSHEYVLVFGRPGTRLNEDAIRTEYAESSVPRMGRTWRNGRGVKGDDREDQDGRDVHPLGARPRSFVSFTVGRDKGNPHPAPMAREFAEHLVTLATFPGQTVCDPFAGSGTTMLAARKLERRSVGIETRADYCSLIAARLGQQSLLTSEVAS